MTPRPAQVKGGAFYLLSLALIALASAMPGCSIDSVEFGLVDTRDDDAFGQYRGPAYTARKTEDGTLTTQVWKRPPEWWEEQEKEAGAPGQQEQAPADPGDAPVRRVRTRESPPGDG